jgi:hypothetical protein
MDDEEGMSEELVTLTRSEWQNLMRSVQSLSQANTKLVETIAYLLKESLQSSIEPSMIRGFGDEDPYDLSTLRRIVESGE